MSQGASSYLRYIQKFRNTSNSNASSDLSYYDKENVGTNPASERTSASQDHDSSFKRPMQADDFKESKNVLNKGSFVPEKQPLGQSFAYQLTNDEYRQSFGQQLATFASSDQSLQLLQSRMPKQEDQTKDMMRVIKLLQTYNETQEDENKMLKSSVYDINYKIQNLEERLLQRLSQGTNEATKQQFQQELKEVGKQVAQDMVKLSRKVQSLEHDCKKRLSAQEEEIAKFKGKVYQFFDKDRRRQQQIKKTEQVVVQKATKVVEEKSQAVNKSFETIQKRLNHLSKEVHSHARKKSLDRRRRDVPSDELYVQTNETEKVYDKKQHQILDRIVQLEKDLEQFRSSRHVGEYSQLIDQSNEDYASMKRRSYNHMSQSVVVSPRLSDSGDIGQSKGHSDRKARHQRKLSANAKKLRDSLDRLAVPSNVSKYDQREHNRNTYKAIMDISFSSDSSDYYETGRSQEKIANVSRGNDKQTSNKRSNSRSRKSAQKNRSKSKSAGKKSYDDLMSVPVIDIGKKDPHLSIKSQHRQSCHTQYRANAPLNDYFKQKEEVLKTRAQRLLQLANLNASQQTSYKLHRSKSGRSITSRHSQHRSTSQKRRSVGAQGSMSKHCMLRNAKKNLLSDLVSKTIEGPNLSNTLKLNVGMNKDMRLFCKTLI